ncbi:IclR family transcriptional regulator [Amycolatopsis thermophila]|uniref:DNA-binding IclR family transcriptional regulator n=1 Tax=Amycolatopsis thermophila TaxID=206084 RepID=A0ABU0F5S5_9PSEU|nr:IclR family transcriptional regulator [Amycolatopsis thermophila]MDQ0382937.1 DNA-binding IclR family transcriptional regulator [Amycolatopsis thermophila]
MSDAPKPTSTQRALVILDCFSAESPRLTLSEIARRLGQPVSSTHRQVGELLRWGALERGDDGRYQIGLHLWEVGSLAPRSKSLREAALPFLEDLYEATHENVQIAVLDGHEVVYIERIFSHRSTPIPARPGFRLPPHATGVGRVLLAHAPIDLINTILAGPMKRFTAHTTCDPSQLRRELAKVRKTGYAISHRQIEDTSSSVAAPIRGPENAVIAALSIVVPFRGDTARRYVPAVLASAQGISRTLGAPVRHPDGIHIRNEAPTGFLPGQ